MNIKHAFLAVLVVGLGIILAAGQSLAQGNISDSTAATPITLNLPVTDDAWVNADGGQVSTNYGTALSMSAGYTGLTTPALRQALLQFDLTALPANITILTGTLNLNQTSALGANPYSLTPYPLTTSWEENTVTWRNKPVNLVLGDQSASLNLTSGPKHWNLTKTLNQWARGSLANNGILLAGPATMAERVFDAHEGSGNPPVLQVQYLSGNDLALSLAGSPDAADVNSRVTYTLTVVNNGTGAAAGASLQNTLPAGSVLASASAGCSPAGGTVVCALGSLAAGASVQVSLVITTPLTPGPITNAASVSISSIADPNLANNSASLITHVQAVPRLLTPPGVNTYAWAGAKVFYQQAPLCFLQARSLQDQAGFKSANSVGQQAGLANVLGRVAAYGSPKRDLLNKPAACADPPQFLSKIVADAQYVYWINTSGLVRLPVVANPGDAPQLLNSQVVNGFDLAIDQGYLYVLTHPGALTDLWRVAKTNGAASKLRSGLPLALSNLVSDESFVYWLDGTAVKRYTPATDTLFTLPVAGALGFAVEKPNACPGGVCTHRNVFISTGKTLVKFTTATSALTTLYTSPDATAQIFDLASADSELFFIEEVTDGLGRIDRVFGVPHAGGAAWQIYDHKKSAYANAIGHLETDGKYLAWKDALSNEVVINPGSYYTISPNLSVTRILVTQGVQKTNNSLDLIQNRNTFVRVFVKSDGPTAVPGVTAFLFGFANDNVLLGTLTPINTSPNLTIQLNPVDTNPDDSFLFELPLAWTTQAGLRLVAYLNPYATPDEPDYADNSKEAGPFNPKVSPRMAVDWVAFGYTWNGVEYWPNLDSFADTASLMRRMYPLASTPGFLYDASPGLRPASYPWMVKDDTMGGHVNFSSAFCHKIYDNSGVDIIFCPSYYANGKVQEVRDINGVDQSVFMYGLFPLNYTPGSWGAQATDSIIRIASGPEVSGLTAKIAAHELGHTSGRAHTWQDPQYPYQPPVATSQNRIGWGNGTLEGIDSGDAAFNDPRRIVPDTWLDLMSYGFNTMWISDHTYKCLYMYLKTGALTMPCLKTAGPAPAQPEPIQLTPGVGDWVSLTGLIFTDTNTAQINFLRRVGSVANVPALAPGGYSIQLLGAADSLLAEFAFSPYHSEDYPAGVLNYHQIVPFSAGTRRVRIVDAAKHEIGSQSFSANSPTVSNVALQSPPNPVSGVVTLGWSASDLDSDPLTYDVYYSQDGGVSYIPVHLNLTSKSVALDTSKLGGSSQARLRVVAYDGAQTGQADSALFVMANKPPVVTILNPANGASFHYGQVINFMGQAAAMQASVPPANMVWSNKYGPLGTGMTFSLAELQVGVNRITLSVTDTLGLKGSAVITVTVGDDLVLPGPSLTAGPSQVGWQIDPGVTSVQTATLTLSNLGSGTLSWTAVDDAAWLTVLPASGPTTGPLTLIANPAGLKPNTLHTATLTITAAPSGGGGTQEVEIPVTLAIGAYYAPPFYKLYLPLARR